MHDVAGVQRLPCGYPTVQGSWHLQGVALEPNELTLFIWMQWEMEDGYICHILPGFFPGWEPNSVGRVITSVTVLVTKSVKSQVISPLLLGVNTPQK
jgi:hypothetical protein